MAKKFAPILTFLTEVNHSSSPLGQRKRLLLLLTILFLLHEFLLVHRHIAESYNYEDIF